MKAAMLIRLSLFALTALGGLAAHAGKVTLGSADMRSVELAKDVDTDEWAERNGVEPLERVPLAGGGAIVRFAMDEGVWRARNAALCTDNGVLSCGTDFCQTYFVPGEEPGQVPPVSVQADAGEQQQGATAEATLQRGEQQAGEQQAGEQQAGEPQAGDQRAGEQQPGERQAGEATQQSGDAAEEDSDVRLELRLIETDEEDRRTSFEASVVGEDGTPMPGARVLLVPRAPDVESLFAAAEESAFDPAQVAGQRSCRSGSAPGSKLLSALTSQNGTFAFPGAGEEGVDRGCWEVVTAAACQTRVQPLSDVLPEREPQRVLAIASVSAKGVINADLAQRIAQVPGLSVLETSVLSSIGKALVRLEVADTALDTQSALGALRALGGIESAQAEYRYRTAAQFNDPYAWMNYGARQTGADRLLATTAGAGVRIAVIDSGVDAAHPELAARIAERIDVTGYGLSADRHGTAVAGLIAAEANNNLGAFGMAPGASLVAIKACEPETRNAVVARCWSSTIAKALDAALARDATIINMSLSGPHDPLVASLINAALARSRLVIAAAGNGGPDAAPSFPASHPGVIAVTAIDTRARLYPQATRGTFVDLSAPGVEVPVPVPGSMYPGQLSGTSMASAHVSGVAALLLSAAPASDPAALRGALESTAVSLATGAGDVRFGRGRIDGCAAARALGQQPESCNAPAPAPTGAQQ